MEAGQYYRAQIVTYCAECGQKITTTAQANKEQKQIRCIRCSSRSEVDIPFVKSLSGARPRHIQKYSHSRGNSASTVIWPPAAATKCINTAPSQYINGYGRYAAAVDPAQATTYYNNHPRPVSAAAASGGRKKAVICGVTYEKKYKLKGALTDVYKIKDLLQRGFGFPENSICILAEDGQPERIPTKKNIERWLKWLVDGCRPGDSLFFYFSGHGLNKPDYRRDELDLFDELLCPVDFQTAGMIQDDDLNYTLVRPLPQGVTLHAIVDTCHSGTILDLPWVYSLKRNRWEDNRPPSGAYKGTSGGLAISLSACRDDQMAADTSAFSKKGSMSGAMTHCFVQALKCYEFDLTYYQLLSMIKDTILDAYASRCCSANVMEKIFQRDLFQEPLLSSSEQFDVCRRKFKL